MGDNKPLQDYDELDLVYALQKKLEDSLNVHSPFGLDYEYISGSRSSHMMLLLSLCRYIEEHGF